MTNFAVNGTGVSDIWNSTTDIGSLAENNLTAEHKRKQAVDKAKVWSDSAASSAFSDALSAKYDAQAYAAQLAAKQGGKKGGTDWLGLGLDVLSVGAPLLKGGGGSSFGNDGFGSFGDYSGIPSGGWGIPFGRFSQN